MYFFTQNRAKGSMDEVRSGVVAHSCTATFEVNLCHSLAVNLWFACKHFAGLDTQTAERIKGAANSNFPSIFRRSVGQFADIADLTARFDIEGAAVDYKFNFIPDVNRFYQGIVFEDCD